MQSNSLTVKWVQQDGGACWFPTNAVAAIADGGGIRCQPGVMAPIARVEFDNGDGTGVRASIDRGTVYILNASGKTIDTIHLHEVATASVAAA